VEVVLGVVEVVSTGPSKAWSQAPPGADVASLLVDEHVQLVPRATLALRLGNAEPSSY